MPDPQKRLLTAQEEVGLSLLMRPDRAVSDELPEEFARDLAHDDERYQAWTAMIAHNTRLVSSITRSYLDQGLEWDDIYQHGILGLMRAIRKFDASQGLKLSTYATWWIRQHIDRGLANESSVIRIPVHIRDDIRKVAKVEERLRVAKGYANHVDIALETGFSPRKIDECLRLRRGATSLDALVGDGTTLGDLLDHPDQTVPGPEAALDAKFGRERIDGILSLLPERTAEVLRLRAGVIDGEIATLEEIGRIYGVSRERIRQIETAGITAIRGMLGLEVEDESGRPGPKRRAREGDLDEVIQNIEESKTRVANRRGSGGQAA
jgi:RNA polymerase primary sigma factor